MQQTYPLFSKDIKPPKDQSEALDRFLQFLSEKKMALYPSQEEAILELYGGANVILNTPTGSGKSLVATALHYYGINFGRRSIYTSPVKALVNEKFLSLCKDFGPEQVGMITGDASINHKAPIICCTAEILANMALKEGERLILHDVIMDEFHYYADKERGMAWQLPLLTLPQCRFLLMSATLGDPSFFEEELTKLNKKPTKLITSVQRPVPLEFSYSETPLSETVIDLFQTGKTPVYVVHFTQREAAENAQSFMSINFCTKEEKAILSESMQTTAFTTPFGKEIKKLLQHGIGIHHAGLLPKYRLLVESLAQKGLLKVICGTDTLGVGVNVPIRTVLFTQLCKFDGQKTSILSIRDFHQIAGRAGRKGFDDKGWVVCQAPAHIIENLKLERKAKANPQKKKYVKAKPPTKGYVHYGQDTFEKLIVSSPEKLTSQFQINHAVLLQMLGRSASNGCRAFKHLLMKSHESSKAKAHHITHGMQLFRALIDKKIVEFIPKEERELTPLRVNVDLQEDFSLNHNLALFFLDAMVHLDPMADDYHLKVLTFAESILENPYLILQRQLQKLKQQTLFDLKEEGVEFEQRIEELDRLEYPKPMADFIYHIFNIYADKHPWIGQDNIRPKSIARQMYEDYFSFNDYIKHYGLERAEGLLLRYLSDVYKILQQTLPDQLKNDAIDDLVTYFEMMIKRVDSSLVDEWHKLKDITYQPVIYGDHSEADLEDITRAKHKFLVLVRNRIFQIVRAFAQKDWDELRLLVSNQEDDPVLAEEFLSEKIDQLMSKYENIRTDANARHTEHTKIKKDDINSYWYIEQMLINKKGDAHHLLFLEIDLKKTKEQQDLFILWKEVIDIGSSE